MTTTNPGRLTTAAPGPRTFRTTDVVPTPGAVSSVASTEAAATPDCRWVEVRTARSLGSISVTYSPAEEARARENRRYNKRSAARR